MMKRTFTNSKNIEIRDYNEMGYYVATYNIVKRYYKQKTSQFTLNRIISYKFII